MKFDYIVGNPPYQTGSKVLYNLIIERLKKLNYGIMYLVIPNRWMVGGKGLQEFRKMMMQTHQIKKIIEYPMDKELFPDVWIRGGVQLIQISPQEVQICHYQRIKDGIIIQDSKRTQIELNKFDIIIRVEKEIEILEKVQKKNQGGNSLKTFMNELNNPDYDIGSDFSEYEEHPFPESIKMYGQRQKMHPKAGGIKGIGYIKNITGNYPYLDRYKVIARKVTSNNSKRVVNPSFVIEKNSVVSATHIVFGTFKDLKIAKNFCSYLETKFVRFLVNIRKISMGVNEGLYKYVPEQDFSKSWSDKELFKMYNISKEEQAYINSVVQDRAINNVSREVQTSIK